MNVLGFTAHRAEKFRQPFETLGERCDYISVADRDGFDRYKTMLLTGAHTIRRERPDVLLANGADFVGFVAILLGMVYDTPVVIRHGGDLWRQRTEKRREQLRRRDYFGYLSFRGLTVLNAITYRLADGYIVVSEELREITHENTSCPRSRIKVVPPHIEVDRFEPGEQRTAACTPDAENVVLTVTNLRYQGKFRGARDCVDEITGLLREGSDTAYIIAGGGLYYDELVRYVEEVSSPPVRDRIHTPGHVDDIEALYELADAFVYVSYIDGYPNVVLEAQAAGLPVISNPAHGMPMQIDHGETGFLVDPSTEGSIREPLEYLFERPDVSRRIGTQSIERVRRENTAEAIATELVDAIGEIHARV